MSFICRCFVNHSYISDSTPNPQHVQKIVQSKATLKHHCEGKYIDSYLEDFI